jgi:hypothetical protein
VEVQVTGKILLWINGLMDVHLNEELDFWVIILMEIWKPRKKYLDGWMNIQITGKILFW